MNKHRGLEMKSLLSNTISLRDNISSYNTLGEGFGDVCTGLRWGCLNVRGKPKRDTLETIEKEKECYLQIVSHQVIVVGHYGRRSK